MIQNRPVYFYKCAKTTSNTDGELKFTWFVLTLTFFPFRWLKIIFWTPLESIKYLISLLSTEAKQCCLHNNGFMCPKKLNLNSRSLTKNGPKVSHWSTTVFFFYVFTITAIWNVLDVLSIILYTFSQIQWKTYLASWETFESIYNNVVRV